MFSVCQNNLECMHSIVMGGYLLCLCWTAQMHFFLLTFCSKQWHWQFSEHNLTCLKIWLSFVRSLLLHAYVSRVWFMLDFPLYDRHITFTLLQAVWSRCNLLLWIPWLCHLRQRLTERRSPIFNSTLWTAAAADCQLCLPTAPPSQIGLFSFLMVPFCQVK